MGGVVSKTLQTEGFEGRGHPLSDLVSGKPKIFRSESHVVGNRLPQNLGIGILKHEPYPPTGHAGVLSNLPAVHPDAAAAGCQQTVEMLDERGFSGAVSPGDHHPLTGGDRKRYPIKSDSPSRESMNQSVNLDCRAQSIHRRASFIR
jgi:hypothetical protein